MRGLGTNWELWHAVGHGWVGIGSSGARVRRDGKTGLKKFGWHGFVLGPTGKYEISMKFRQFFS
jgi:hypothetical protein